MFTVLSNLSQRGGGEDVMKKFFSQHSVDLYFVLAPTIFVLSLLYFMPAQVPGHMDLLGNINRWGGSRGGWLFVGFLFSYLTLVAWFAGKKFGGVVSIISSAAMLFLYLHWALMLLGIMYVTPGATNIYALEWDLGKRAVGTLVPIFTLYGMVIHKAKPNWLVGLRTSWTLKSEEVWVYTHRLSRLPFLIVGGCNYLILAIPPIPELVRLVLSFSVTLILFAYLLCKSYEKYQVVINRQPNG